MAEESYTQKPRLKEISKTTNGKTEEKAIHKHLHTQKDIIYLNVVKKKDISYTHNICAEKGGKKCKELRRE